jgi:hypothetical protein
VIDARICEEHKLCRRECPIIEGKGVITDLVANSGESETDSV